jgi:uncharacterized repeat protein (TIGR03803 family)
MDGSGNLYGTTFGGGGGGTGTVYRVTPDGKERVLYSFGFGGGRGYYPIGGVSIDASGNLFGTTQSGGRHCGHRCDGVAFEITASGAETTLFGFKGHFGRGPDGGVIIGADGALYGTTSSGGANQDGVVFKLKLRK